MARRAPGPGPGPGALPPAAPAPLLCLLLLLLAAPAPARAQEAWRKVTLPVNYEDAECRTPRAAGGGGGEGGEGAGGDFQPCERGGQPGQATGRCPKVITAGKCYALCNGGGCKPDESTMYLGQQFAGGMSLYVLSFKTWDCQMKEEEESNVLFGMTVRDAHFGKRKCVALGDLGGSMELEFHRGPDRAAVVGGVLGFFLVALVLGAGVYVFYLRPRWVARQLASRAALGKQRHFWGGSMAMSHLPQQPGGGAPEARGPNGSVANPASQQAGAGAPAAAAAGGGAEAYLAEVEEGPGPGGAEDARV